MPRPPEMEEELPPLDELPALEPEDLPLPRPTRASKVPQAGRSSTPSRGSSSAPANRRAKPKATGAKTAGLEQIRNGVEDLFVQIGVISSPFLPVTGTVMTARSGEAADRIVLLCEQDSRVYRAMLRMVKYNAYLGVGMLASTLAVAVSVDINGPIRADSLIASRMVGKEIELVEQSRREQEFAAANGSGVAEPQWAGSPAG